MASRASDAIVVVPSSGVVPVAEANGLMVWSSAGGDDDGCNDETDKAGDLDCARDDLGLTKEAHTQEVCDQDEHQRNRDNNGSRNVCPV